MKFQRKQKTQKEFLKTISHPFENLPNRINCLKIYFTICHYQIVYTKNEMFCSFNFLEKNQKGVIYFEKLHKG